MSSRALSTRTIQPFICPQCRLNNLAKRTLTTTTTTSTAASSNPSTANTPPSLLQLLQSRGLINQLAAPAPALTALLSPSNNKTRKPAFYAGVDPTAPSLHLGHLLPLIVLFWAAAHGFPAISLIGGATAKVGDPTGRLVSREVKGEGVVGGDAVRIRGQVEGLWGRAMGKLEALGWREGRSGKVLDNAGWLGGLGLLEFLGTMGRGVRVGGMLGRDTVRNKMEKGDGMSFAEFTYPLLQAWDWWHMFSTMDVQIQVGGSDQYGNIIAGIDAVKFVAQIYQGDDRRGERPHWLDEQGRLRDDATPMGLTVPLLTTSSGEKLGKSAGNAVWLDPSMTSPFDLYGFLLRTPDADTARYLNLLTFLPLSQISTTLHEHSSNPSNRTAQHLLATEILSLVHGEEVAAQTREQHAAMRKNPGGVVGSGSGGDDGGTEAVSLPWLEVVGVPWTRVLLRAGLVASGGEASRMVSQGAVYLATNNTTTSSSAAAEGRVPAGQSDVQFQAIRDPRGMVKEEDLLDGKKLLVRMGKWKVRVIEVHR